MSRSALLFLCLVGLTVSSALDGSSPVDSCNSDCENKYSLNEIDACKYGCSQADSTKEVSNDSKETNTCDASCDKNYHANVTMVNACKHGCSTYISGTANEPFSFLSTILGLLGRLQSLSSGILETPTDESSSPAPPDTNPKVRVMIVRRIRIRIPSEDEAQPNPSLDTLMSGPFGGMMRMGNDEEAENLIKPSTTMQHMVRANRPTVLERMSYAGRYVTSHPMIVLFTLILVALCILLIVQISMECKRRSRRANQFQFDQLPTYVEATTIKVPIDSDFQDAPMKKPLKA